MDSPMQHFADLRDPRVKRTREHLLEEILLMTIAAILSGCNGWNEIEDYGNYKHAWFKGFLTLPSGIPWFCRNSATLLFFALTARCRRAMRQTLNPKVAKVLK